MSMAALVSVPQAAEALGISPTRVRALIASGELPAAKVGDRWLIEEGAVERRRRAGGHRGRPFSPRNSWAVLALASEEEVRGIDASVRSRLKRALAQEGLARLRPRLSKRGEVRSFQAHPGELAYLLKDPGFVRSGVCAAQEHGFGLVPGNQAEGYLQAANMSDFIDRHALEPAGTEGNIRLRVVPDDAWSSLEGRDVAPKAAVALDLAEDLDPRSAQAGRTALREMARGGQG